MWKKGYNLRTLYQNADIFINPKMYPTWNELCLKMTKTTTMKITV